MISGCKFAWLHDIVLRLAGALVRDTFKDEVASDVLW